MKKRKAAPKKADKPPKVETPARDAMWFGRVGGEWTTDTVTGQASDPKPNYLRLAEAVEVSSRLLNVARDMWNARKDENSARLMCFAWKETRAAVDAAVAAASDGVWLAASK